MCNFCNVKLRKFQTYTAISTDIHIESVCLVLVQVWPILTHLWMWANNLSAPRMHRFTSVFIRVFQWVLYRCALKPVRPCSDPAWTSVPSNVITSAQLWECELSPGIRLCLHMLLEWPLVIWFDYKLIVWRERLTAAWVRLSFNKRERESVHCAFKYS